MSQKYWPLACEYSIWNATVTALQFWMVDLELHALSNAIDQVYTAFFYSDFTQQMQNLSEGTLFSHFLTTLNNAFETELAQEDGGYESGSESLNIPTPLSRAPRVYHVSTVEDLSFNPANFGQSPTLPEHHEEHSPWGYRYRQLQHAANECSSVPMMRVQWDTNTPALMLVVQPAGVQIFHHQSIITSTIMEHPHKTQSSSFTDVDVVAWDDDTPSSK